MSTVTPDALEDGVDGALPGSDDALTDDGFGGPGRDLGEELSSGYDDGFGGGAPFGTGTRRVFVFGGSDEQRMRVADVADFCLVDEVAEAELVVISTRASRAEFSATVARLHEAASAPIVALAHTGGESLAVEVMRGGGVGIVAEGNEDALAAYANGTANDASLVETYDRRVGSGRSRGVQGRGSDDATNLPGGVAFEERLEELDETGVVPRVAFLHVLHFDSAARKLASEATDVLRRRLAVQYRELARVAGAELYVLDRADFALIGVSLSPARAEDLGRQLSRVTESFAPMGSQTLRLAMGHAGPEVTTELATLRELASRALGAATEQAKSAVVGAASLSLGLASTTELEAALRMIDVIERYDRHHPGHSARVARIAAEIARHLGFDGTERAQLRLAAHLHGVGKIGLPKTALDDPDGLDGEDLEAYRSHPERGAVALRPSAGDAVADAIRHHHEHWDGSGFPDGSAGHDIPVMARVIAIADRYDELLVATSGDAAAAVEQLGALGGTVLDPNLLEASLPALERAAVTPFI